uniref:tetratricopeptide repeat protein n=2 Tax=Methanospirillum sp. TaxID=45200 RepID=UPI001BD29B65
LEIADETVRLTPQDADAWYNRGVTLGKLERYEEEVDSYKQALTIRPNFSSAWENMGASYFDQGKFEEAIAAYHNATSQDQSNAVGWYYIGTIYEKIGQVEEAIQAFEKAIEINPNLGNVKSRLDKMKENLSSSSQDKDTLPEDKTDQNSSELFSGFMNILK